MLTYNPNSIKTILEENKITQSNFARKIGASRQKVYNWLTLGDKPDTEALMTIAQEFNKEMSHFFL